MSSPQDTPASRETSYLTVEEACEHLGIRRAWFFRLVKRYNIPRYKRRIGRKAYYRRSDLKRLLAHDPITDTPANPPGPPSDIPDDDGSDRP